MIIIGLTGSIGMGKSTVAGMFEDLGVPAHNSDTEVHELLAPGGKAYAAVAEAFPGAVAESGEIDRKALGALVFKAPGKRRTLEGILHPLVRQGQQDFLLKAQAEKKKAVVLDVPLLFETGADKNVDVTVTVQAPEEIQRARVLARPGMTEERLEAILESQMPSADKCARSDYVVETGGSLDDTFEQVKDVLGKILSNA